MVSALLFYGPMVGLAVTGLVLLLRPGSRPVSRAAGLAVTALLVGYLIAFGEWLQHACYDVGDPEGCDTAQAFLTGTWIAALAVCVVAAGLGIAWWIRRSRHGVSSSSQ